MKMYRQGDVLIVRIEKLPENVTKAPFDQRGAVLAEGELTGHAHTVLDKRATLFRDEKLNKLFLQVEGNAPVALKHQEHDTIALAPGDYEVIRQREYSPQAIRNVAD